MEEIDYNDWKKIGGDRVSAIGLGTWAIRSPKAAIETLTEAINTGKINMIDTAEMYGSGEAERIVGEVARRVGRDNVFITTKILPHRLASPTSLEKAVKASLNRLATRQVDLLLIHWPNPTMPIERQVRMLETMLEKGYTRYIGVSNFNKEQLLTAITATKKTEITVNQIHYSILHREPEETSLLKTAIQNNITIQAYTPLEHGRVNNHPTLREIAKKTGKTPVQIALNYLISKPRVTAIPKTENRKHLHEILGALGWRLDKQTLKQLAEKT
ncbi:MAG: aldo/keto reductase [Hyperthermus sp.]|nr:MAG: aldo/keto reductase [Hyperthermus sp.]